MSDFTLVQNDQGDWIGLYKDGKLIAEGHSFQESQLLNLVGVTHDLIWDVEVPENMGGFPDTLDEVIHLPGAIIRTVVAK